MESRGDYTSWNKVLIYLLYTNQSSYFIFGILGFPLWAVCISISFAKFLSPPPNPNLPPPQFLKYFKGKMNTHTHTHCKSKWEKKSPSWDIHFTALTIHINLVAALKSFDTCNKQKTENYNRLFAMRKINLELDSSCYYKHWINTNWSLNISCNV